MTAKFIGSGYPNEGSKYYTTTQADSLLNNKSDSGHSHAGYQTASDNLTALSGLTSAANKLPYFTGTGTASTTDITSLARTLLGNSSTSTMQSTLGLVIGTNVQAYDADLQAIGALSGTSGFLKKTGANTWSLDTSTYLTSASAASTYQPLDSDLTALAGLSTTGFIVRDGSGTAVTRSIVTSPSQLLSVSNGDGVSGNPTISLVKNFYVATAATTQSIPDSTSTLVTLSGTLDQSNSILYYDTTGAVVTETGYYEISGCVVFSANTSGYRQAGIYLFDGTTAFPIEGSVIRQPASSVSAIHTIVIPTVISFVDSSETIQLRAYQTSGGSLSTSYSAGTGYMSQITIKRIG